MLNIVSDICISDSLYLVSEHWLLRDRQQRLRPYFQTTEWCEPSQTHAHWFFLFSQALKSKGHRLFPFCFPIGGKILWWNWWIGDDDVDQNGNVQKVQRLFSGSLASFLEHSRESVPFLQQLLLLPLSWLRLQELMEDKNHVNLAKSPRLGTALSPDGLVKCQCAAPVALAHFNFHLLALSSSPLERKTQRSYYGMIL